MALRSRWAALPLSLGSLPAVLAIPAQEMLLAVRQTDTSSDGAGAAPYRTSPSFLLFALTSLVVGGLLLVAGKRLWRVTTALGAGLLVELLVWVTSVNTLGDKGFASSAGTNDIILWAIVTACAVVGLAVGGFFWRVGMGAISICGGMSLGFSIALMAEDALPVVARWIIIGVLTLAALLVFPFTQKHVGMAIATSLTGSFLLFLGIDLLANQVSGMSLGLRYMLDGNDYHSEALSSYDPPVVTRVLLAVSWCVAMIAGAFQTLLYRQPFIPSRSEHDRLASSKSEPDIADTSPRLATPPGLAREVDPAESLRTRMNRRYKERLAQGEKELAEAHGSEGSQVSAEALNAHLKELSSMSSPDDPPTRPNSVVSTELANQLRSRPPTFFNEPLSSAQPAPAPVPPSSVAPTDPSTFVSQVIPIIGIGAAAPTAQAEPTSAPTPVAVPLVKRDSGASSKSSSRESRMSWRKPPPPLPTVIVDSSSAPSTEELALPVARPNPHSYGIHTDADRIAHGLTTGQDTGRDYSIALTASTPSSGDFSTLIKPDFGAPPLPRDEDMTSTSFPTGPRLSLDSSVADMTLTHRQAVELVPFAVSPPSSDEARRHSMAAEMEERSRTTSDAFPPSLADGESFRTAASASEAGSIRRVEMGTPDLVRDDETVTSLPSPQTGGSGSAAGTHRALGLGGGKRFEEEEEREELRL